MPSIGNFVNKSNKVEGERRRRHGLVKVVYNKKALLVAGLDFKARPIYFRRRIASSDVNPAKPSIAMLAGSGTDSAVMFRSLRYELFAVLLSAKVKLEVL